MNVREFIKNLLEASEAKEETITKVMEALNGDEATNAQTVVDGSTQVKITPPQLLDGLCVACKQTSKECGCIKKWVEKHSYEGIFAPQISGGIVVSIPEIEQDGFMDLIGQIQDEVLENTVYKKKQEPNNES